MVTSDLGACEWFVWDLRRSGLIDRGPLDAVVGEFLKRNPRAEAPALAEHLVDQGTLTPFQAERILNGKSQGLVLGPFVLLDAIGSGSMGQVYRASSKNDGNQYAVKVLPRRSMWNVRLARRQTRQFASFTHPAVVPFLDVGTAGGLHYLVWPMVDGTTLEGLIQQVGKLPVPLAALYAVQVAQGLAVAHQNNLFHGLVKPSNVMVGPDNQARILDFGIGSLLVENEGESLVDTMSTANTLTSGLDCAAPESIMEPTNRTPAGDQYSLGCVLYYCLTGRVPFPEGSAVEKMMAHQLKEPTDIRELAPEVPEKLAAVVKRLMSKAPEARFTGCDEVVEALEPFLGEVAAVPQAVAAGSGRVPTGSGRVPAAAARRGPGGSGVRTSGPGGSGVRAPSPSVSHFGTTLSPAAGGSNGGGRPSTAKPAALVASLPGVKLNPMPPAGSHAGTKLPAPQPGTQPSSRTPAPARGPSLPSRASFQLPPLPLEADTSAGGGAHTTPVDEARPAKVPSREALSWADDGDARPAATFGAVGLVALSMLIMAGVYFGATFLMK